LSTPITTSGERTPSSLTISLANDVTELERLRGEWEQLLGRSAGHHFSLTPTWLLAWWRVFGPQGGRRLHALVLRDGETLVGLVPLLLRRHWHRKLVPMRRLELVASGEDGADEILSEYLGPIAAVGYEERVVEAFVGHLTQDPMLWQEIVFSALDEQAPAAQRLGPAFSARGFTCQSRLTARCPFIRLPKSWEDYVAALSSDDRYMVKRSLRDFERWVGKAFQVEVARTHEDLARGKEILHRLHTQRWQSGGRDGAFASPVFRSFHDRVMPALLDRGELDLRWLVANGEPIAVSYSVIQDNRIYYYQGGRATDVPKGVRPGIVLHLYAIRAAIEAGRAESDFLGGDARYKLQLSTATRPLVELRVVGPSFTEAARVAMEASRALLLRVRGPSDAVSRDGASPSEPARPFVSRCVEALRAAAAARAR
jgi:CelD/BcsL family acetyltransferase involved in cellulose biosynthesis